MADAAAELAQRAATLTDAEFVKACHAFWQTYGTLPSKPIDLSGMRREALRRLRAQAQKEGRMVQWIAAHLGFKPNRFSRLTRVPRTEAPA